MQSFDDFLARRFPESRRKACHYQMSIHYEHLPPQASEEFRSRKLGWTKAGRVGESGQEGPGRTSIVSTLVAPKPARCPKEQFKHEVEKELTGLDSEATEIIYFKFYKSQIPVIEQAIETAGLMLGTDKSRGYCLEMICADFLAGANLDAGNSDVLLYSILRLFNFLPSEDKKTFLCQATEGTS